MDDPSAPSVPALLAAIEGRTAAFWARIVELTPEGLDRDGTWTAKDHLAHLAMWERSLLALLDGEDRAAAVGLDADTYRRLGFDAVNANAYVRFRDSSFADVRTLWDDTHAALLARLSTMTNADLLLPYSHFQPHDPPENTAPVIGWILGNTIEHYDEHIGLLPPV